MTVEQHTTFCMKRFLPLLILALAVVAAQSYAQTTAYDFLRIPIGARTSALGNTSLTFQNDPTVLFSNPGGLSTIEAPSASLGFVKYLLDINAGYAAYSQKIENFGWVGGGIVYMNYGSFEQTDINANSTGTFSAGDIAVSACYANVYENFRFGGAVKVIYSSIQSYSSSAFAIDAGAQYLIPSKNIVLGVSILNLGGQMSKYGTVSESLPLEVSIGASTKPEHLPLLLFLNFHKLNESQDNLLKHLSAFSLGGEFTLSKVLKARIGYNNELRRELKLAETARLAGFSLGFGVAVSTYNLDYAYNSFGRVGDLHRISLGATF
jgi:hypothetical protein